MTSIREAESAIRHAAFPMRFLRMGPVRAACSAERPRLRCFIVTHPIAKASIRARICGVFRGILQADGYAGFAKLYDNKIVEAACMRPVFNSTTR
jgi:hypothetical protein